MSNPFLSMSRRASCRHSHFWYPHRIDAEVPPRTPGEERLAVVRLLAAFEEA